MEGKERRLNKTRMDKERTAAGDWHYQPGFSGPKLADLLLQGEFLSRDELAERYQLRISRMYRHACRQVPYYRDVVEKLGLYKSASISRENWLKLPLLSKSGLIDHGESLRARCLMQGQQPVGTSKTSGTTGQPVVVHQSSTSLDMFAWLKQRELRWFRYKPQGTHLSIRPGEELARTREGTRWPDGQVISFPGWPYLNDVFKTGPAFGFASTNPVHEQLGVLEKVQPDYLLMEPATLEHLSMQAIPTSAKSRLKGIQSISQTLTPGMKEIIASGLEAPIHQNYGLNEIGLVASMCPEGGRYHVHEEHCGVELITESGALAVPGERGKIVVTSLNNSAMPLLRYDTEDSAEMADDNCPCGRSLLSFVNIEGRYRRLAQLPEGSYQTFKAVQAAVNEYARNNSGSVGQYQVCQLKDESFEVIINCSEKNFVDLQSLVEKAFTRACPEKESPPIAIFNGQGFRGQEKKKFQIFYSELMPDQ